MIHRKFFLTVYFAVAVSISIPSTLLWTIFVGAIKGIDRFAEEVVREVKSYRRIPEVFRDFIND